MANITSQMVKELREMTQAGMMDCKKALVEAEGEMEKAIEWLRAEMIPYYPLGVYKDRSGAKEAAAK